MTDPERIKALERENARLRRQLAEQHQLANAARMANIAVLERLDLHDVLATLLDALAGLVPFDAACVMMLDDGRAVVEAGVGYIGALRPGELVFEVADHEHLDDLVQTMRSVCIADTQEHPSWQHGVEVSAQTRSWLGVPLIARGTVLGLYAMDKLQPRFFTDEHVRLAEGLADHAALAIANAQLVAGMARP